MDGRRQFLKNAAAGFGGLMFANCGLQSLAAPQAGGPSRRREVSISGRRIRTVDIHGHCLIPDAWNLIRNLDIGYDLRSTLDSSRGKSLNVTNVDERLQSMDTQGIDVQAVSISPYWYSAGMDVARELIKFQNEKLAEFIGSHPDRFVGMASIAMQYPFLAAEQLEDGVKRLGLRGCMIAASVNGEELSSPRFHPFWAKAEELGAVVFIHPQTFPLASPRLRGNGYLDNVIGNPLDTTVALSHLIFEGTLDRFPGVKICAAHGGGYLPSYIARSDQCVQMRPNVCKPTEKMPSEYLRQLYFDSLVFSPEALHHLAAEAGPSQILMGTDYPYGWTDEPVDHILKTPNLSDDERAAMLGGNAARLLRL